MRSSHLSLNLKLTSVTKLFALLLLVCLSLAQTGLTSAQKESLAAVTEPNLEHFPTISTYLDIHDAQGKFISGLTSNNVTVLENELSRPIDELTEQQPGVRLVVAVNAGPALGIRDLQGISRYDVISQALQDWFNQQVKNELNEYSLLANTGAEVTTNTDPQVLAHGLRGYQPDMRLTKPAVQSLAEAIDLASDPLPRVGMGRAILYITPVPEADELAALPDLSARAQQMGVRIFTWIAASLDTADPEGLKILEQVASVTGGAFFVYNSGETLPDPSSYLEPLGKVYFLRYTSAINQSGRHSMAVKISRENEEIISPARFFSINVQPPNPMFVSPPSLIERASQTASSSALENLQPDTQQLEILVEFPDGYLRPLKAVRLYVDGIPIAENTQEPFNQFSLPLSGYSTDQEIIIKVEVEDSLGLTGSSIDTPVEVTIKRPARSINIIPISYIWITAGAVAVGAGGLTAGLVLRQHRRNRPVKLPKKIKEPATQPARAHSPAAPSTHHPWSARLAWSRRNTTPIPALAQLIRLSDDDQPVPDRSITITSREVTLGRDPTLATVVIDLPSLAGLHARLRQDDAGQFILYDQDSVAGTWVNYTLITSEGTVLEQGDLVHIGEAGYRFAYSKPPRIRQVVVKPYQEMP